MSPGAIPSLAFMPLAQMVNTRKSEIDRTADWPADALGGAQAVELTGLMLAVDEIPEFGKPRNGGYRPDTRIMRCRNRSRARIARVQVRAVPLVFAIHYPSAMVAVPKTRMNVNEYLTWALTQPGRYELVDGEVVAMSPESAGHAAVKFAVQRALLAGVQARRLPCHVLPDGMTVRIDEATAYEPDALVYCGATLPGAAIEVPNPVIVVEVLSRSTRRIDASAKLADYFRLPSVAHYLIVDPDKPLVVHHARGSGETILTRVVTQETIELDPPGLALTVDAIELLKTGDTKSWSVADHSINRP